MRQFVGREEELRSLKELARRGIASLVVIRGRRRIGKSRLIEEFGRSVRSLIFSGVPLERGTSRRDQIEIFIGQMVRVLGIARFKADDWGDVFFELSKHCAKGKVLIALDEISWIGSKDRHFLGQLKNAWDLYFSKNPGLVLVICGSISSWIERNILNHTGFLGRISLNLHLKELPLVDAVKFWQPYLARTSALDILKTLSVVGGVPRYLEAVLPRRSADQNIQDLCFDSKGILYHEFNHIFSDLFSTKAPLYVEILCHLAEGDAELGMLHQRLGDLPLTSLSRAVHDLIQAGFVSEFYTWSLRDRKRSRLKRFRVTDNYVRFYLKYVEPHREAIAAPGFKAPVMSRLPGWDATMGLQFENLVVQNTDRLLEALGESPGDLLRFGPYFQRKNSKQGGCQIDLLMQMRYRTLFLCEIKFRSGPIGMDAVRQLEGKRERLAVPRGMSTRLVLVHANGVTPEVYQSELVDYVVSFGDLIGLEA